MGRAGRYWKWIAGSLFIVLLMGAWIWYSPDLMALKQRVAPFTHHPAVIAGLVVLMGLTLAVGLPGSIGLWLIAPFYPPLVATAMLTLGSVAGALGGYQLAARTSARWQPKGLTLRVMQMLQARSDLLTQCALRVLPGFPHAVINFAAGLSRISLSGFLLAAALGLTVKWGVYSSAIYGALEAIEEEDALQFDVLLPLLALTMLLLAGAWFKRRSQAAPKR
ncbi:putative membrane protein YdjX (TVP38/TMEM64 family) [Vreelandella songnenensis]|uniref:Putative membrane protein YdjX (TVP38/TMEM64 family) n=1 Tax=Vreelandella songnenensis TaxID=1176243 RepID=A0A2T0V120_9GAMM|nr:VTT domain-containing protein [Halomonas songnenensis]PRY63873.1 putative membrane protein YdjX (TVP38/TMEM64 family) [Halomonas songnenensis]